MAEAAVGDDYGEDRRAGRGSWRRQQSAVRGGLGRKGELQEMPVELLGLERTLFVPSNTMANLISVMCHCQCQGSQLLLGQECHLHIYEQGGVAQIARVYSHSLPDLPHGTLDLAELERMITRGVRSPYHQVCELICLENSHSTLGGRVLSIDYLRQVHLLTQTYKARVHLDGAQLMNMALALHVPPPTLWSTVTLCLSASPRWESPGLASHGQVVQSHNGHAAAAVGGGLSPVHVNISSGLPECLRSLMTCFP
ncbi:hypothetical protein H8959_019436 [Pygathrix nigripes]